MVHQDTLYTWITKLARMVGIFWVGFGSINSFVGCKMGSCFKELPHSSALLEFDQHAELSTSPIIVSPE